MVSLTQLLFSGGINEFLFWAILITFLAILIAIANKFIDFAIPDFLVGIFFVGAFIAWIIYFLRNFLINITSSATGLSIVIAIALIIVALFFVGTFSKGKNVATKAAQNVSPQKTGEVVKNITKGMGGK